MSIPKKIFISYENPFRREITGVDFLKRANNKEYNRKVIRKYGNKK